MKEEIGKRIEEMRKNMGLTKDKFAKMVGYSPTLFARVERGDNSLTIEKAVMIHQKTGVSLDYLLTGKESVPTDEIIDMLTSIQSTVGKLSIEQIRITFEIMHNIAAFCNTGDTAELYLKSLFHAHKRRI